MRLGAAFVRRCKALPPLVLLALAVWTAWRPAETVGVTGPLVAFVALTLTPWAWRRTSPDRARSWLAAVAVLALYVLATGLAGWDAATLVVEALLAATVGTLAWSASRERAPELYWGLLALALATLSVWAVWQVAYGFERALSAVGELPPSLRDNAVERLSGGRAFASLPMPSHLAALLATALPLLIAAAERGLSRPARVAGVMLCLVGLLMTRSPIGVALAVTACGVLLLKQRRVPALAVTLALAALLLGVVVLREDVAELEPVALRLDNWRTALWVWSLSPITGVGVGGFGQAALEVPFVVGNQPAHAHCLPLEWAAEMGVVGLALAGCCAVALWRLLRRLWSVEPALAVALAVVPVHNLVDFSLYASGVALPWSVLLGWGMARARAVVEPPHEDARGRPVLVGCAALALAVTAFHATSSTVERAAAGEADLERRWEDAVTARRLAPWRLHPLQLVVATALDSGQEAKLATAAGYLNRSRWLRRRSLTLGDLSGQLAWARGEAPIAVLEAWRARSSRPRDGDRAAAFEHLLERLGGPAGASPP